MSFQDEIKNNFRTKEQAEQDRIKELQKELMEQAESMIKVVKSLMLNASKKGEYTIINGENTIIKYWSLPFFFQKEDAKKVPASFRKTFFGRVELVEAEHYIVTLSIDPDKKEEYTFFLDYLISLAEKDGIKLTRIVAGKYSLSNEPYQIEPIPFVEKRYFLRVGDPWEIFAEFSVTVP